MHHALQAVIHERNAEGSTAGGPASESDRHPAFGVGTLPHPAAPAAWRKGVLGQMSLEVQYHAWIFWRGMYSMSARDG